MNVLIAQECSGRIRNAFRHLGHNAWSCDLQPDETGSLYHMQCDIREVLDSRWDLMIAHPVCRYLANSGVRWLSTGTTKETAEDRWQKMEQAVADYKMFQDAPIKYKAIENPVMHRYAKERLQIVTRQIVQPWWFGDPAFKATGLELYNLPPLVPTNKLTPPLPGTEEHKKWSAVHREPPGPDREKNRSRTFPGMAATMASQWG